MNPPSETTQILAAISHGDHSHVERLMEIVYDELRAVARRQLQRESVGHTLDPTALVHEVFVKLVAQDRVEFKGRTHFCAVSAQAMRRILVDHARNKGRQKRGGGQQRISLDAASPLSTKRDIDVLAVDEAIQKLVELDPQQASIVEMRFFGGMTMDEVAEALGISKRTVERQWTRIRAWLRRELAEES